MILSDYTFLTWQKALVGLAALIFTFLVLIVYYALRSLFVFKKTLNSYETSIKMTTVGTITLIRDLAKLVNYQFDEETVDKLDDIEYLAGQNTIKGFYKEVYSIYLNLYNHCKGIVTDPNLLYQIENNFKLQKEIDRLYQKALFYHATDLIGYNYWVKFWLTRPFTKMFGFKTRESVY